MRLLVVALVVCIVAVAQANRQGSTTKASAACKSSADCKKTACGKSAPPASCDKAAKKCVCKPKTTKKGRPATTTPEAKADDVSETATGAAEDVTADGSKAPEQTETHAAAEEEATTAPPA